MENIFNGTTYSGKATDWFGIAPARSGNIQRIVEAFLKVNKNVVGGVLVNGSHRYPVTLGRDRAGNLTRIDIATKNHPEGDFYIKVAEGPFGMMGTLGCERGGGLHHSNRIRRRLDRCAHATFYPTNTIVTAELVS